MTEFEKIFSKGYICACANIMRTHGSDTIAEDCLKQNFLSIEEMKEIGVPENDIEDLTPIILEIERKRKIGL